MAPATMAVAALAMLLIQGRTGWAQKNGLAFWEPDPARVDPMLGVTPKKDAVRFGFLRRSLVNFDCKAELMEEQPAGKHGAKNLICTLPGKTAETIFVVARFDDRGKDRPTWPDALLVPLLYHALQAQPRQHTFTFAALDGYTGERAFLQWLHRPGQQPPSAMVVLDSLGMGLPNVYIEPTKKSEQGKPAGETKTVMWGQGLKTRQLMGIQAAAVQPEGLDAKQKTDLWQWQQGLTGSTLFTQVSHSPAALIFSEYSKDIAPAAFHQDFDFVALFLCGIDVKLDSASKNTTP